MSLSRRSFVAASTAIVLSPLLRAEEAPGTYWVYVGTYTGKDGSKGIYRSTLDAKTGKLSAPEVAAEVASPSFVAIAPNGQSLYAIGEAAGKDGGGVYSWKLDPKTGALSGQVALTSGGPGPCHISTDAKNQFAIVANYGGGSVAVFKLKDDGSLAERSCFVQHKDDEAGDVKPRTPRGHSGFFDATGTLAFVCDLGLDEVKIYKLDRETGKITPNDPAGVKMPKGTGPRHIHIAPDNTVAFVCGELAMTINVIAMDVKANKFELKQTLSTTPEGKPTKGGSTAEVRIHPNGKFVYVSNRGHNSIAVFEYDAKTMTVKAAGHITGEIQTPRNFNITPCGKWMLVCSQDSAKVAVFAIDEKTGMAKETANSITVDRPVCVKFLAKG